jgi:hypothetical protein
MLVQRTLETAITRHALPALLPVLLSAVLAVSAAAQEAPDVYGPPAPQNAGFVRVVNAGVPGEALSVDVGPQSYGPLAFGDVSAYRPVESGIYLVQVGDARGEVIVRPEGYRTIALTNGEVEVIADTRHEDPARAQLVLYNFLDTGPAELLVAADETPVIEDVGPGAAKSRAVNAVTLVFAVRTPAGARMSAGEIELTRGDSFGVFLAPGPNAPAVFSERAGVELDE